MNNLVKLRIAMECAEDEWKAMVLHSQKAPTPEDRTGFDIKAERAFNRYWTAHLAYFQAVKEAAAEQEQHDTEGLQSHPQNTETVSP